MEKKKLERIKEAVEAAWAFKDQHIAILWEGEISDRDRYEYGKIDWKKEEYCYLYHWNGDRGNGISPNNIQKKIPLPPVFIVWNDEGMTLYEKRVDTYVKTKL